MNNEPVAWMDKETGQVSRVACYDIPLYTEAVVLQQQAEIEALKAKTLTDEEIHKLWLECWDEIDFARAILRKAQENASNNL